MNNTARKNSFPRDLGIYSTDKKVFLFSNLFNKKNDAFRVSVSTDGLNFKKYSENPVILSGTDHEEDTLNSKDFRISKLGKKYYLTFKSKIKSFLNLAESTDLIKWKKIGSIQSLKETGVIIENYKHKGQYVIYFGESEIKIAFSNDLKKWDTRKEPVLKPRNNYFDNFPLQVGNVFLMEKGILVLYFVKIIKREGNGYSVGAAIFDKNNPEKLLWRKDLPVLEQEKELQKEKVYPLGIINFRNKLIIYLGVEGEGVYAICFDHFDDIFKEAFFPGSKLKRFEANPIIKPVLKHMWESQATFNTAAVNAGGKVHFLYRAIGDSNTSVIGYATSRDGINIDERLKEPVYIPKEQFEVPYGILPSIPFLSGGGYGGCEDPRITKIDDRFYMTYVAFNGMDHPRVALTSISTEDFQNKNWDWRKSKLISKPGEVNKNACIFPEKVNGKYVVMHRVFPDILIDFLDDLEFNNPRYLKGKYRIKPRGNLWDSRKVGAGSPPIKTKDGWLLIYHAVDDRCAHQYKIGAMLLDLNDPTKVLYRSNNPILEPKEKYENEGYKSGVCYPCGSVVLDGNLIVYYGGADTVICGASKKLDLFLNELKESGATMPDQRMNIYKTSIN